MSCKSRLRFCMLLMAVLCAPAAIALAQTATLDQINARLAELTDPERDISENPIVLADDIRSIGQELEKYRTAQSANEQFLKELGDKPAKANDLIQEVNGQNCETVTKSNTDGWVKKLANLTAFDFFSPDNPWRSILDEKDVQPKDVCQKLKAEFDPSKTPALLTYFDTKKKEYETAKIQTTLLIEALQKRRAALQKSVSQASTQSSILTNLWLIIGAIGVLSIGTIFVIKLFSPELQIEWVRSGQVIQFVTVMILLSVIMALGLAGILKENTLGTLLGGIGGYVLSQGVGRAAASAVTQSLGLRTDGTAQATPIAISSVEPNVGPEAGGTLVVIKGTGFLQGATITLGGTQAPITSLRDVEISVTTPAHAAGSVDVVVTNTDGRSATSIGGFTYQ